MKIISLEHAVSLVERDHGGCESNTCTIGVALRNGFHIVAVEAFFNSGAASEEFNDVKMPYSLEEWQTERDLITKEIEHVECPHCNATVWEPEWVTNNDLTFCDNCAREFKKRA